MSEVPQGTVAEVLDWVGDDPARAREALDAEYAGQNRSTLLSQLEAITEEAPVSESTTSDVPVEEEMVPAPEQPTETVIYAEDAGTVIHPVAVRDAEVEVPDDAAIAADPAYDRTPEAVAARARGSLADADVDPIEGEQVEYIGGASGTYGLILSLNGTNFALNKQMVGALKQVVDRAVVGLAL